jgi:thiamine kinase-like enzyme
MPISPFEPAQREKDRAAQILGWTPDAWRAVSGGYTPAARYAVSRGADRAFVKIATTPLTTKFLQREIFAYERVRGAFMPRFIGASDDDVAPMLVIEDLGDALWPPPWDKHSVDRVLEQIAALHAARADLRTFRERAHGQILLGWRAVADDPRPFLDLGFASSDWLVRALPQLIEAEAACPLEGASVVHFDLRSDNICFAKTGVKFIDWAEASLGNPALDTGFWLPSLCFEGGPKPDDVLPDAPDVAAWVSGFFAARAGLPDIPDAPFVRRVQREQLSTALPWVMRALRLGDL